MAIRDKMAANAQALLEPGEKIQAVIGAQTKSGWLGGLGALILLLINGYVLIVATDRRIAVMSCGRWSTTKPKSLLRSVARTTRIGPPHGLWWKCESLGDKLYVNKRFHKDVESADALLPAGTGQPLTPPS